MSKRKVSYFYDSDVGAYTYGLGHPMKPQRMRVTHELVTAYGMLDKMHVIRPKRCSPKDMTWFHTDEYVHFLQTVTPETAEKMTYHGTRFLVGEDNPAFEGVFEFCSISAGGSISAAERIACGAADISINWAGGLHHAKKREASGFCYINDINLGILELLRTYARVLYIDIDIHHGDGVEEAFYTTDRVMTVSFHKFGEYFPGTGTQEDRGRGKGKGYSLNVPLKDGTTDEAFQSVFEPVMTKTIDVFRPSVIILQCGADSLAGDKLGSFNLTMHGHARCVQFIKQQNIPLILLGGGGYTVKNVARTWTYETACALGIEKDIDSNLPWNDYFEWFGPRYRLEVPENNMEDLNVKDGSLDIVRSTALEQLQDLASRCAPSVQMQDVPRESLSKHLGLKDEQEGRDDIDRTLAQHARYVYNLQDSDTTTDESENESWDSDDSNASTNWRRGPYRASSVGASASSSRVNGRGSQPPTPNPRYTHAEKKRMSLLTGQYFDVPSHEGGFAPDLPSTGPLRTASRRRFFQSGDGGVWDDDYNVVDAAVDRARDAYRYQVRPQDLAGLLDRTGRIGLYGEDGDEDEEEGDMSVEL
ncbi:histone deacetylase RPD3 [Crepidotus variabilis]|uniref:histone deacetylase n=1 Tax=Crepidotus variabilis TaxID=179855 RepID=A0A9P6JL97_9AGAR|nr:histone deacetylase RPD3 [Crepidotus variabilis]